MTDQTQKLAAIDAALSGMFQEFEARGVPEHLLNVVDQLEASELSAPAPKPAAAAEAKPVRPSRRPPSTPEP